MQSYKQTTAYTLGPASLLIVLNHFDPTFKLTRENEFRIWHKTVVLPTRWCSIFALAKIAHERGIVVNVVVGNPEYKFPGYKFKRFTKEDVEEATFSAKILYSDAKKSGVDIEIRNFDLREVKNLLLKNKIVMLRIDTGLMRKQKHDVSYVLVSGYKNHQYEFYETHEGKKILMKEDELKTYFDSVTEKCKRDSRMIVFG
ncbi:MAG TPA: peptidase C39 family protein [Candidatus Nanoarchaeia archaeon]|nr:peptidase C39 family protein [Candidatus Nanoarchaeia archaeon]